MRGAEVREGGKGGGLCSNLWAPILCDLPFHFDLPGSFGGGIGKHFEGVRKVVLGAKLAYLNKPWN